MTVKSKVRVAKTGVRSLEVRNAAADNERMEVVWTTGAIVLRYGYHAGGWGWFEEELSLKPSHIRMSSLKKKGIPFLDMHQRWGNLRSGMVLGRMFHKDFSKDSGGTGEVLFSRRAEAQQVKQDYDDGVLSDVSVGYRVFKYKDITAKDAEIKRYLAVDWQPKECSGVDIGADDGCVAVRNDGQPVTIRERSEPTEDELKQYSFIDIESNADGVRSEAHGEDEPTIEEEQEMAVKPNKGNNSGKGGAASTRSDSGASSTAEAGGGDDSDPDGGPDLESVRAAAAEEALRNDAKRREEIAKACSAFRVDDELRSKLLSDTKCSVEMARAKIQEVMEKRDSGENSHTNSSHNVQVGEDLGRKARITGATEALLHRAMPNAFELTEVGHKFRHMGPLGIAMQCLAARGLNPANMAHSEIAREVLSQRSMHATSDYPLILENTANKLLLKAYMEYPTTHGPLVRETRLKDFKPMKRLRLGDAAVLKKKPEGGEITMSTISENGEVIQLATYENGIMFSREMLINDDMDAFADIIPKMGRRARELDGDIVWGIVTGNPVLSDNVQLFHADHNNLDQTSSLDLGIASLSAMRKALRGQKGLDGARINVPGKFLIVPAALETEGEKLVSTNLKADAAGNINPFAGRLQLIVESRLDEVSGGATTHFLAAGSENVDTIELARLEGQEGPQYNTELKFGAGVKFEMIYDVAAKALDFRGLQKNTGVTPE